MTDYLYLTMDDISKMVHDLWDRIKKSGFKPDCLIGISRGGLIPVRILSDISNINDVYIVGVKYYQDIEDKKKKPIITQDVNEKNVKGKIVLFVDDVSDTGESIRFIVDHLKKKGIKQLKTLTLHYKPWSVFKPDYYLVTTKKWIIYPWEEMETIKKITERKISEDEKRKELSKTGIPEEKIKRYVNRLEQ